MHIWQPRVALPSAKLMMATLEEGSSCRIRSDVWKHIEKSGPMSALQYVDFATRSMPTSEGPAIYASILSETVTT